jgi:hypothetical protein
MVKKLYSSKSKGKKVPSDDENTNKGSLLDFVEVDKAKHSLNPGDSNSDSQ